MSSLQDKKDRLLIVISLFPLDPEVKQKLTTALQEELSEQVIDKVVGVLKSQISSLTKIADLLDIQEELDIAELESQIDELEIQLDEE